MDPCGIDTTCPCFAAPLVAAENLVQSATLEGSVPVPELVDASGETSPSAGRSGAAGGRQCHCQSPP